MNDTSPEVEKQYRELLLSRSGSERFLMGSRMFDVALTMVLSSFPPGLSDIERKPRLCQRLYGDEVDVDAFIKHLQELNPSLKSSVREQNR